MYGKSKNIVKHFQGEHKGDDLVNCHGHGIIRKSLRRDSIMIMS